MKLKGVLSVSAIYLAVLGVGFMLAPRQIGIDAVPPDASPALIAYLRIFGGPILGIAVLNWMARNAEPSAARNAIVLGNIVGFGCVTLMDVWGVFSGGARPAAKLFLVIHLLMTVAFVVAGRASMRAQRRKPQLYPFKILKILIRDFQWSTASLRFHHDARWRFGNESKAVGLRGNRCFRFRGFFHGLCRR